MSWKETQAKQDAEANHFAMCLLMPREAVMEELKDGIDLTDTKILKQLADKFQVSELMMGIRIGQILNSK